MPFSLFVNGKNIGNFQSVAEAQSGAQALLDKPIVVLPPPDKPVWAAGVEKDGWALENAKDPGLVKGLFRIEEF